MWVGKLSGIDTSLKMQAAVGGQFQRGSARKRMGHAEWIDLAQNVDIWRPLVNTVMNFWVP